MGRSRLDGRAVDVFVPSKSLISNSGSVLPTSVPIDGWPAIKAALVGVVAKPVSDLKWEFGTGSDARGLGKTAESVPPAPPAVIYLTVATGPTGGVAGVLVVYAPQPNIPANIAISGNANIRDIREGFSEVEMALSHPVWVRVYNDKWLDLAPLSQP